MKNLIAGMSRLRKLIPVFVIFLLPSLAQAHPGFPEHTHNLSPTISDAETYVVVALAAGLLVFLLWTARRSRVK